MYRWLQWCICRQGNRRFDSREVHQRRQANNNNLSNLQNLGVCEIWSRARTPLNFPGTPLKHPKHLPLRFLNFHTFSGFSFLRPRQHGSRQIFERTKLAGIRFSFTWEPCKFFEGQTVLQTVTEFIRTRVNRV